MKTYNSDFSLSELPSILKSLYYEDYGVYGFEKILAIFLTAIKIIFPMFWIRNRSKNKGYAFRNTMLELYLIFKCTVLFMILKMWWFGNFGLAITLYFLTDIILYLMGIMFLPSMYNHNSNFNKNFLHLLLNLTEIVFGFSILYLATSALSMANGAVPNWIDAIYFSIVTFATIGYGDITTATHAGKLLVSGQVIISFLFVTIIVSRFIFQKNAQKIEVDEINIQIKTDK